MGIMSKKKRNDLKFVNVRQFCRGCKNMRMFQVKKKLFVNLYCLRCITCGTKITYPSRFVHSPDLYFKEKKPLLSGDTKTLLGAWFVMLFLVALQVLGGRMG